MKIPMHGPFPGGDPRNFEPDREMNTAEEIEAWEAACELWDANERDGEPSEPIPRPSHYGIDADRGFVYHALSTGGFGYGTYQAEVPDDFYDDE